MFEKVSYGYDTGNPPFLIQHRQCLDLVMPQEDPGLLQRGHRLDSHNVPRHDIGAGQVSVSLESMASSQSIDMFQVAFRDVHKHPDFFQRFIDIAAMETQPCQWGEIVGPV
jgi:hypothetical protein